MTTSTARQALIAALALSLTAPAGVAGAAQPAAALPDAATPTATPTATPAATPDDAAAPPASTRKRRKRRRRRRKRDPNARRLRLDRVSVFGGRAHPAGIPGSAHALDEDTLQRQEADDVHRVLQDVPGVYTRDEEGYGLRPNIGMRGANPERSAKVMLMEDGIPIAPGPYAAPAAYYFPLITRMHTVEVLKGPAAVRYGPSTVGGAVNMRSRPIPAKPLGLVDLAAGNTLYGKAHAAYGDSTEHVGWLLEATQLRSDGFKRLDLPDGAEPRETGLAGRPHTGFNRTDALAKLRLQTDPKRRRYHSLVLRLGYARERSHETYTGLTHGDFERDAFARYAATEDDLMRWQHLEGRVTWTHERGDGLQLRVVGYHHRLHRDWGKIDGFGPGGPDIRDVLARPNVGNNAVYAGLLRGEQTSTDSSAALSFAVADRSFVAQGLQAELALKGGGDGDDAPGWRHEARLGVRLHQDVVDRDHTSEERWMTAGRLESQARSTTTTLDATGSALALAAWAQDDIARGDWTVSPGVRSELVWTRWRDHQETDNNADGSYVAVMPGLGALYRASEDVAFLAGVHRGFLPVAPGQSGRATPERSWNAELGGRYVTRHLHLEVIGFGSLYENLKGTCTFSSGCLAEDVGNEFDGGEARVLGVESLASTVVKAGGGVYLPLRVNYTFTTAQFLSAFSSDNPQWGDVAAGDALPYLPRHVVGASAGFVRGPFELHLAARYQGAMRDTAGSEPIGDGDREALGTDPYVFLDASATWRFGPWGRVYATGRNLTGATPIVSRRPYGVRPGMARLLQLGYEWRL